MQSETCALFIKFLEKLNESVKGKKSTVECPVSELNEKLLKTLDTLSEYIDQTPPVAHPGRFANPAYRTWFDKMSENALALVKGVLPAELQDAALELAEYVVCSFGDRTRCDYGTGHETNYLAFLCCLDRLGLFQPEDYVAVVVKVFLKYMAVMRKLQTVYILEPAGSKGVWAIDDFHFMVFYFGSSQLRGNTEIVPSSVRQASVYNSHEGDYMYLAAIKWINKVKTGPFFEHSPTLDGIANVPHWEKVNQGMMKMYKGEVLSKFPVMQHFKFGSLLPFQ
uniref:Serine/threonine-protein phosphatase 2A activator n=1 Tax=Arcella intermedia TaxID=1963864 RepID=A0A6B2LCB8_9EUKA